MPGSASGMPDTQSHPPRGAAQPCAPRKHPEPWEKTRSSLPQAGSEGPLALRRTSFAQQLRLCQPPLGYFPPSPGARALLFPEERPSFQQRVLESWGRTGVRHCDKMKLPVSLQRQPGQHWEGVLCCPGARRGAGLGRRTLVKTLTFFHLRLRTFRSGWPICTWLWFGLSRERSNWASFKCFIGIQIPFSFSGGKPS